MNLLVHCHLNKLIELLRLTVTSADGDDVRGDKRQRMRSSHVRPLPER